MTKLEELAAAGVAFTTIRKQEFHAEATRVLSDLAGLLDWTTHAFEITTNLGTALSVGTTTLHATRLLIKVMGHPTRQRTAAVSVTPCEGRRDFGSTKVEWIPPASLYEHGRFLGELKLVGLLERSAEIESTPVPKRKPTPGPAGPTMG